MKDKIIYTHKHCHCAAILITVPPESRAPMKQPTENRDTIRPCKWLDIYYYFRYASFFSHTCIHISLPCQTLEVGRKRSFVILPSHVQIKKIPNNLTSLMKFFHVDPQRDHLLRWLGQIMEKQFFHFPKINEINSVDC